MDGFGISKEAVDQAEDRASAVDGRLQYLQSKRGTRIKRSDKSERTDLVTGRVFDSKQEMKSFLEIRDLGLEKYVVFQPRFEFQPKYTRGDGLKVRSIEYHADFLITRRKLPEGRIEKLLPEEVVIDVKGMVTAEFRLKQKIFDFLFRPHVLLVTKTLKQIREHLKNHPFRTP